MAKHSFEFKKKVVLEYLDGKGGVKYLSKKYGLGSDSQLRTWVNAYNAFGDEGLMRSRKQTKYSFEKKISVVELYLSSEISYQDLAIQEGINNPSMIANWVNRFRTAGPDALKSRRKGRKKTLDKPQIDSKTQKAEERIVDTSAAFVLLGFLMSSQTQVLAPSMATHAICITPGATLPTRALLSPA